MSRTAAVVHLGGASLGQQRRIETWSSLLEVIGYEVVVVRALHHHPWPHLSACRDVAAGRAMVEATAWSARRVTAEVRSVDPSVVVCVTGRVFRPQLCAGRWTTVLDYVDLLSESYAQRALLPQGRLGALGFQALAASARRFERSPWPSGARTVAAGYRDALVLGAAWLPNAVRAVAPHLLEQVLHGVPGRDLVFFGTLDYLPNVDALRRLSGIWPRLQQARPGTSMLVTGQRPTPAVRRWADECGWDLRLGFGTVAELACTARLAVAPLAFATGIQNKVLEAAAHGLPLVASPEALAGTAPGFPARVGGDDEELVIEICALLNDADGRRDLARSAWAHIGAVYCVEALAGRLAAFLEPARAARSA